MFVAKPGWYHTIIGPIESSTEHQQQPTDEAMQQLDTTIAKQSSYNTEEAMQNSMHHFDAEHSHANCDVDQRSSENNNVQENTYSQLTIPSIDSERSYIHGRVESQVTNVSPDGKRVSICIEITLS